jgi:hypothetical protein
MTQPSHADLRRLVEEPGPFATVALPTPSEHEDAATRFALQWKNARKELDGRLDADRLDEIDRQIGELSHAEAVAVVLAQAASGASVLELLDEPIRAMSATVGPLPRLTTILEARQRTVPHIVVMTDRAGADIIGFDGGDVLATETVEGETLHIHRGHPGGWSQRRFQQRAENTWEDNARSVADAVAEMANQVSPELIAVAGDVRAVTFLLESLPTALQGITTKLEAGDADHVAEEVVRLTADHTATRTREVLQRFREAVGTGTGAATADATLDAFEEGRVELLLVHDDGGDEPTVRRNRSIAPPGTRLVDAAVAGALRTDAGIRVVPGAALGESPVGAILRW